MKHKTYPRSIYQCFQLFFLSTLFVLGSSSCANYNRHIAKENQDWKAQQPVSSNQIDHTVFLIGDAGNAALDKSTPTLEIAKLHLEKANEKSHVVFLGDNIYPVGMPPKHHADRKLGEHRLNAQLEILDDFKGTPIFLPGNHDWYDYSSKGVRRQENYIEAYLNKGLENEDDWENYFLPDNACSGPEVIEVNDKLVIIVIDSNWFVINWNNHPNINEDCDLRTREAFRLAFDAVIKKNKSKNILIALHHPIKSNSTHGGHYSARSHLFPIPGKGKNIPVPVLGTIANGVRAAVGSRQDITHSIYQELINTLITPASASGEFIFASGHDHNLQYFDASDNPLDGQHYIVSGAGSKKSPTVDGNGAGFSHGNYGFSKLDYYKDGSVWMEFWSPDKTSGNKMGELVFRKKVKGAFKQTKEDIPTAFPNYETKAPTFKKQPILTPVNEVSGTHDVILGRHYRDVYLKEYDFKTLDLETYKGGLQIIKKGGGMQTNSLRLINPEGEQYVMRSFTKDATRGVAYPFNRMAFVGFVLRDNYLATHPFGALPVPTMADACNVFHANPSIFFVPKQPRLGVHNDIFGDEVYIFEERAGGSWEDLESFGNASKIISTIDVTEKIHKNHNHHIDEKWVARSRLFDLVIGDWDRHDDQWRWVASELENSDKLYRPIPRDRDQAFSKYDGALVQILRPLSPFLRQIADYQEELGNMKWVANNTRHFDHAFLTELTIEDWRKEAQYIKDNLTDEIIDEAFTKLPEEAFALSGERIKEVLRYRRDHIVETAERFYLQLSKKVAITGTDKRELFEVRRLNDDQTIVEMYALSKNDEKKKLLYNRTFNNAETKEIFLYGLEKDDVFNIEGDVSKSIVIRIVGGSGDDVYTDNSSVKGLGKKTKVYDSIGKNTFNLGGESNNKTNRNATSNFYDRKGSQYDEAINVPFPVLGVTADDGFLLGFSFTRTESGFFKEPYGRRHDFGLDYAFATKGLSLNYSGEYIKAAGNWDIVVNADAKVGRYAFNFYGIGNETATPDDDDLDYNRVRQTTLYLDAGWQRRFAGNYGRFSVRPIVQFNDIEPTADRFITEDTNGLDNSVFESTIFTGATTHLEFENVDDLISPNAGIKLEMEYSWNINVEDTDQHFHKMGANFTIYKSVGHKSPLTLATKVGTEHLSGNYPFYFAPTLGQDNSLRGFRPERFRGNTTFYHTTDLRWTIFSSKNVVVPFSFGIFGGFDYGRIFQEDIDSDVWHNSYGGGFWIAPLDYIVLSFGLHHSDENDLFRFQVGHDF